MEGFTRVIGKITIRMERVMRNSLMLLFIRETMCKASLKDVEGMNGQMDKYMKGSGKMDSKMDLVFGEDLKGILI